MNFIGSYRERAEQFASQTQDMDGLLQRAQYDTSDPGLVNEVYGPELYAQYNSEANFRAVLPVVDRSDDIAGRNPFGESVVAKAFRARHSPVSLQTHSEGGAVPAGTKGETEEVSYEVKRSVNTLEGSDLLEIESRLEDAVSTGDIEPLMETELNLGIDRDALTEVPSSGNAGYSARDEITELFRAISSSDEEANGVDETGTAYTNGDLDYGSIDRSTDTWADSFVDHNSGIVRQLNRTLMDSFLEGLGGFGSGDPYKNGVILTGRDSARVLSDLMADRGGTVQTIQDVDVGTDTINDAETIRGIAATTRFRHYDGIPIVANQNAPSTGSLSDIFVLNTGTIRGEPRIAVEEYMDMYTERAGRGQAQGFLSTGEFKEEVLMKLDHEVVVKEFGSHGKITVLEE